MPTRRAALAAVPDIDVDALPVWPAADLWPMLGDADLIALGNDIADRGMIHPLITYTDPDGATWLLDGRNRRAAIAGTGIVPPVTAYDGADPDGYVLALNLKRRHSTPSQIAMIYAQTITATVGKRVNLPDNDDDLTKAEVAATSGVSAKSLSDARYLLEHLHKDLRDAVMARTMVVSAAAKLARFRDAKARKAADAENAKRATEVDVLLEEMRDIAPDLADEYDHAAELEDDNGAEAALGQYDSMRSGAVSAVEILADRLDKLDDLIPLVTVVTTDQLTLAATFDVTIDPGALQDAQQNAQRLADHLRILAAVTA
jgi:hypothetical protein